MSFANKVVLVTGASSGIGAAIARLFSKEGANVAIVGRNEIKLRNVAQDCEQCGNKPLVIKADVSDDDDAKTIIESTIERFGKLDVLVNNAGIMRQSNILEGKALSAYDEIMTTNVRAVVNITSLAVPYLVESKGNIVNISSIAALSVVGLQALTMYCASKAALDQFSRGIAQELAPSGVRVNCVNPGPVRTDIIENSDYLDNTVSWDKIGETTALSRVGEPEEIADLVLFVASDKARGITGSVFVNDNGKLLKP